jgi:hypothetical protein
VQTEKRRCEMRTMSMPGFTAEASVYRTSRHYLITQVPARAGGAIHPASFVDPSCYVDCHLTCDCSGQTGANLGACILKCNADCRRECTIFCPTDQAVCGGNCCAKGDYCCGNTCCPEGYFCHEGVYCDSSPFNVPSGPPLSRPICLFSEYCGDKCCPPFWQCCPDQVCREVC